MSSDSLSSLSLGACRVARNVGLGFGGFGILHMRFMGDVFLGFSVGSGSSFLRKSCVLEIPKP